MREEMAGSGNVDIDLYAGVDELDHELNQPGNTGGYGGGGDLYEDVLAAPGGTTADHTVFSGDAGEVAPATPAYEYKSFTTTHPKSAQAQAAASQIPERSKGKPLYVGNFTWWTTDRQLEDALQECGATDIVNVKFFENRANGQSKGYALVELGSDVSVRLVTEKLPLKDINGQSPVVTPATKNHLHQFEVQARKINPSLSSHDQNNFDSGANRGGFHGRGFRGRGGIRPGMGRAHEFGHDPMAMAMGNPWMGPGGPMLRPPQPGLPPFMDRGMPPTSLPGDKGHPGMGMPGPMGMHPGMSMVMPMPGGEQRRSGEWDQGGLPKSQVAPHFNPAFFPPEGAPPEGAMIGMVPPVPRFDHDFMGRSLPPDIFGQFPRPGEEFNEYTRQNQVLTSNSIKKAMVESNAGQHEVAIETLVQAISIIKQSPVAQEDTSHILVQSLQDCLQGIEQQMLSSSGNMTPIRNSRSGKRDSRRYSDDEFDGDRRRRKRRSRSKSRSRSRSRSKRSRSRDRRSRSRSRDRHRRR